MTRLFLALSTAVVVLPSLAGARVQAGPIYWSASGSVMTADPGPGGTAYVPAHLDSSDTVPPAFIQMFPGGKTTGTNSGSVVVTYLSAYNSNGLPTSEAYQFGGASAQYQLSLLLRDQTSGVSGTLTFHGYFNGWLPYAGSTSDPLTNTFVGPTTQTLKLGSDLYTVAIGPAVVPQAASPGSLGNQNSDAGSISASISVQPLTNSTPEPSSLVLACLGLPSLGLTGWFRRRRA